MVMDILSSQVSAVPFFDGAATRRRRSATFSLNVRYLLFFSKRQTFISSEILHLPHSHFCNPLGQPFLSRTKTLRTTKSLKLLLT